MGAAGVLAVCSDCAVNGGGSCCGEGIEDRFDAVLLLVNRLMECVLPDSRSVPDGCWFLGEKGCRIVAREVICVNYVCRRLEVAVETGALRRLQERIAQEADASFVLQEALKRWLRNQGL
jgi:hypothetical protein